MTDRLVLALRGRPLPAADRRVLGAFAAYAATALEQERLAAAAEAARPIAEADRMRTALLAAVSHDLRTPLASAKAAVTSLRATDVQWAAQDHDELLATADESLDKLAHLVDNLLDMSRLQAGALAVFPRPADLAEIVARSLDDLGPPGNTVVVAIADDLPEVAVDPGILERVIANLTANALRYSPPGTPPTLRGSALLDRVELRVIDRGPGIPVADWTRVFVPFQRLGDTDNTTGVGLGLALSRGLTEAMGGTLEPEETPGGGLTMTLSLPAAPIRRAPGCPGRAARRGPAGPAPVGRARVRAVTTVLVVDDEPQILRALRINLRVRHYDVHVAGHRRPGPGGGRHAPARPGDPGPGAARPGRRRGHRGAARLDRRADHRAVRPGRQHRQGRGPGRGRGRLRDQAVQHGRAAGPDARGQPPAAGGEADAPQVRIGDLTVDLAAKRVTRPMAPAADIRLTPTEWHLLEVLVRTPGKLLSQQQLLTEVWGPGYQDAAGNLRLYMAQLRRKLEPDPARPRWLLTEPGMGYRFQPGRPASRRSAGPARAAAENWLPVRLESPAEAGRLGG